MTLLIIALLYFIGASGVAYCILRAGKDYEDSILLLDQIIRERARESAAVRNAILAASIRQLPPADDVDNRDHTEVFSAAAEAYQTQPDGGDRCASDRTKLGC